MPPSSTHIFSAADALSSTSFGTADHRLLISGCSSSAGGLFVLRSAAVTTIDLLRTHGLAVRDERLYRVMGCQEHAQFVSDLLVYDRAGVRRYDRLDGVGCPHDVLPREGHVLVSSSMENAIYRVQEDGSIDTWWRAKAPDDAWHLNCLVDLEGEIYATAFTMSDRHRRWAQEPRAPTGVLLRLPSEEVVLSGLTQPHSPRRVDGAWLVCNSALREVALYDDSGAVLQRREFAGYTRGLAVDDRHLYVGQSARRRDSAELQHNSRVTIVSRDDWSVVDEYEVEAAEIYDLVLVPEPLVAGAQIGFRTNATRVEQENQLAMFASVGVRPERLWAVGEPLPHASLKATLEAVLPATAQAAEVRVIPCRVTNHGDAIFVSAPPNPIQLCYRWFDASGDPVGAGDWIHTPLPRALPPGESIEAGARVGMPPEPGTYTLALTLLQEGVAWLDDLSPAAGVRGAVVVV
jgi:acetolactate synthase-1/2/3 large subunit